mgnify:CR=1 FL=1
MKKRTLRSIAFVLVVCLVIPSFFVMAGAVDYAPLRYDTSALCSAALSISSSSDLASLQVHTLLNAKAQFVYIPNIETAQ